MRQLHLVSRLAYIRVGDRRDPGGQAGELMLQHRNVSLGEVVPNQAQGPDPNPSGAGLRA